jgi:hypothetical protein
VTLDSILYLAGYIAEAAVVALLLFRGVFRTFPIFFSYLVWSLLSDAAAFVAIHLYSVSYKSVFLVVLIIDHIFQFGVLVELSWSVLRPLRAALPRWTLPAIATLILLIGAIVWPLATGPGLNNFPLDSRMIFHVQTTFAILRILFFLVLAGFSQLLSIGWRDRELQIATGLGFYSLVSLAVWMRHASQAVGGAQYHLLDQMVTVSYVCSLAYWGICFATKEAKRREFTPQMQSLLLAMAGTARSTRIALAESAADKSRDRRD